MQSHNVKNSHTQNITPQNIMPLNSSKSETNNSFTNQDNIWKKIFDTMPDWIFLTDLNNIVLQTNKACEKFTNISINEIPGKNFYKLIKYSNNCDPNYLIQQMILTGKQVSSDISLSDGKWINITIEPIKNSDNKIESVIHIVKDITQQKKNYETLKISEQKLKNISKPANDAITYLDTHGKIIDINDKGIELFGGSKEDLINKYFTKLGIFSLKNIPKYIQMFKQVLSGSNNHTTIQIKNTKGQLKYLECSASLIKSSSNPAKIMVTTRDITEQIKAEQIKIRNSIIINSTTDSVIVTDINGTITSWNKGAQRIYGYKEEEVLGKSISILYKEKDIHILNLIIKKLLKGKDITSIELTCINKDNHEVNILLSLTTIKDINGKIVELVGITKDITERKQTKELLRSNEAQLSNAAKIAKIGYWEYDVSNQQFILNDQFYSIFHTTAEQIGGYTMSPGYYTEKFIHSDDRSNVTQEMKNVKESKDTQFNRQLEHDIVYANGKRGTVSVRYFVEKNDKGRAIKIYGAIQDITERKKYEEALQQSEEKFRNVVEKATEGIIVIQDYKRVYVNPRWLEITSYSAKEYKDIPFLSLIHTEDLDLTTKMYKKHIKGESLESNIIFRLFTKYKEIKYISAKASSIQWENKPAVLVILEDVSYRKKTEIALSESEQKYRLLFEKMINGFALHEVLLNENNEPVDYKFIEVNSAFEKLTGLKRDDILNKNVTEVMPGIEKDPANWIDKYSEVALTGKEIRFEDYSKPLNKWYSVIAFQTEKGKFATIFEDITERKNAEESLKRSEYNLSEAQRIAQIGSWALDLNTWKVICSDEMLRIWGLEQTKGYMGYEEVFEQIHPEDCERVKNEIEQAILNGTNYESEFRLVLPNNNIRFIHGIGHIEKDSNNKPRFIRGTSQDITERKKDQQAIVSHEFLLNETQKLAKLGGWEWDLAQKKATWTDEVYKIYGVDKNIDTSDLEKLLSFYYEEDRDKLRKAIDECVETYKPYDLEVRFINAQGKYLWCRTLGMPIFENGKIIKIRGYIIDITERKEAEIELKESEKKYRLLIETLNEGIWTIDSKGYTTFVNSKIAQMLGYTIEEMLGKHLFSFMDEKWVKIAKEKLKDRSNGVVSQHEFIFRTKNGELVNMLLNTSPIFDYQGNYAGALAGISDITEYVKAMERIKTSEVRYRELFENMPSGVAVYDVIENGKDFIFKDFNRAGEKYDKQSREELIGKSIFDMRPGAEKFGLIDAFRNAVESNKPVHHPITMYEDQRLSAWYENYIYSLPSGELVTIFSDVTEKKKIEEELKKNEEKLRLLAESIEDVFWMSTPGIKEMIYVSPSYEKIWGKSCQSLYDNPKSFLNIVHPEDQKILNNIYLKFHTHGKAYSCEYRIILDSERVKWVFERGFPVYDNEGKLLYMTGICTDITSRKQIQDALHDNEKLLNEVGKIAKIGGWEMDLISRKSKWTKGTYDIVEIDYGQPTPGLDEHLKYYLPEYQNIVEHAINQLIERDIPLEIEAKLKTAKGNIKWCKAIGRSIRKNGSCVKIFGTFQDITYNKHAEEILNNHRRLLEEQMYLSKTLLDAIPCIAMLIRPNTREIVASNKAAIKAGAIPGKTCFESWLNCTSPCSWCVAPELWKTGKKQHLELEHMGIVWDAYWIPVSDSLYMHFAFDITERKQTEQKIRNLAKFPSENPNPVIRVNQDGIITYGNGASKVILETWEQNIGECLQEFYFNCLKKCFTQNKVVTDEFKCKNGQYFELVYAPVKDLGYVNIYGLNITERKRIEASILKYQEQLKSLASQLTLTEEKERYRIAMHLHDQIGQYLAVSRIKLVELLNSNTNEPTHNTLKLVDEWLYHAIKETRSLTYDLSSPILHELGIEKAVVAWLDDEIRRKYKIQTEFYSDKLPRTLDNDIQVLLFRNIRELLFNVIKHAHASKVIVSIKTKNNKIIIKVEDNGIGFNLNEIAETATDKAKFGLFSIRERLESFGGNIEIDTAPNAGCKITLIAPLKQK